MQKAASRNGHRDYQSVFALGAQGYHDFSWKKTGSKAGCDLTWPTLPSKHGSRRSALRVGLHDQIMPAKHAPPMRLLQRSGGGNRAENVKQRRVCRDLQIEVEEAVDQDPYASEQAAMVIAPLAVSVQFLSLPAAWRKTSTRNQMATENPARPVSTSSCR
jgi:hypothetical protein